MGRIADNGQFWLNGESNIHNSQLRDKFLNFYHRKRSTNVNVVLGDVLSDCPAKVNATQFMDVSALDFGIANKAADT